MADYACYCFIGNGTGAPLTLVSKGADHGSWEHDPPGSIPGAPSHEVTAGFKLKDNFGPRGSAGWVKYKTADGETFTMSFACPDSEGGGNYGRVDPRTTAH